MKRAKFLKRMTAAGVVAAAPIRLGAVDTSEVIVADAEIQMGTLPSKYTGLLRAPLTVDAVRAAFRSPQITALRIAKPPSCVGIGWKYLADIERDVAEIDVRSEAWASEEHLVRYATTFFTRGGVSASKILREMQAVVGR